jgi:hypothetical protein
MKKNPARNASLAWARVHGQSFHKQRVVTPFIVEDLMRIIGKHVDTKLLKTPMKVGNRNYLRRKLPQNF